MCSKPFRGQEQTRHRKALMFNGTNSGHALLCLKDALNFQFWVAREKHQEDFKTEEEAGGRRKADAMSDGLSNEQHFLPTTCRRWGGWGERDWMAHCRSGKTSFNIHALQTLTQKPCDTLIGDAGVGLDEDNRHNGWQSQLLKQTYTQQQLKGKKKGGRESWEVLTQRANQMKK